MVRRCFPLLGSLVVLGLVVSACAPAAAPPPPSPVPATAPTVVAAPVPTATPAPTRAPAVMPTVAPSPTRAAPAPRYGGILQLPLAADPPSFDLAQELTAPTFDTVGSVSNGLVQYDPLDETKVIMDLAEKWEVSPDGKTYIFYLRKGVKFHNGDPFTSADAKLTLEKIIWPPAGRRSPLASVFQTVKSLEAPDDYTLKINLQRPAAGVLAQLAATMAPMQPKRILEAKGDMKKDVVGTGPYKFKDYIRGVGLEVEKNPDYFVKGRPYMDGIKWYVVKDMAAQFSALRTKRLDLISWTVQPPDWELIGKEFPEIVRADKASNLFAYLGMNVQNKPFNDPRVRRAVSLSIDRAAAVKVLGMGKGAIGDYMPAGSAWNLSPEELAKMPGYGPDVAANRAEAKRLLAEAGYPDGFTVGGPWIVRIYPKHEPLAVFLQDQMAKIGIKTKLTLMETAAAYDASYKHGFDLLSWTRAPDLDDPDVVFGQLYVTGAGNNYGLYSNPKVDELYLKQSQTLDPVERKKVVDEMQRATLQDVPAVVAFWYSNLAVWWPRLRGYVYAGNLYKNHKYQDVWIAE